jgi:hypothetical protein
MVAFADGPEPSAVAAAPELARKVVDHGSHSVTYVRIAPPQFAETPSSEALRVGTPTLRQHAARGAESAKTYVQLWVVVYPATGTTPSLSELTWWENERRYQVWSTIDFGLLPWFGEMDTASHVFGWVPGSAATAEPMPRFRLEQLAASARASGFCFEGTPTERAQVSDTLTGLGLLHVGYRLREATLAAEHARRTAEAPATEAETPGTPTTPSDSTIRFWRIPTP